MDEKKRRLVTNRKPPSGPAEESMTADEPMTAAASATATKSKPMSTWSIVWRLGATAMALVILTCGQFLNTNDFFPLGSLTQYATAKDLNGTVNATCIEAQFPGEDEPRRLGFNTDTVGIERGDIESQLDRVIANPELMQTMADSFERLHPDEPKPEQMILCRTVTQLENGRSVGEPEHKILATWEVQ
ncbi:hypothetical protein FO013_09630 [Brevibacterium aurantiacum]|uniref:Uncharacterized protein n=2 Tax=Brevibacterium aurantiacum TaxID=273384 RepID=A0A556CHY7_BREAU|nr:hypothetical protein FO013_09630 [Brevibacterium aurantiacum]